MNCGWWCKWICPSWEAFKDFIGDLIQKNFDWIDFDSPDADSKIEEATLQVLWVIKEKWINPCSVCVWIKDHITLMRKGVHETLAS